MFYQCFNEEMAIFDAQLLTSVYDFNFISNFISFVGISERLDVAFALDSSNLVSKASFNRMKEFVKGICRGYQIAANQTRVSLVTYGNKVVSPLSFKDGVYRSVVEQALFELSPIGGRRNVLDALTYVAENLFKNGPGAGKLLVLIVGGVESDLKDNGLKLKRAISDLKGQKVETIIVGIGKEVGDSISGITKPEKTIVVDDVKNLRTSYSKVMDDSAKVAGIILFLLLDICYLYLYHKLLSSFV